MTSPASAMAANYPLSPSSPINHGSAAPSQSAAITKTNDDPSAWTSWSKSKRKNMKRKLKKKEQAEKLKRVAAKKLSLVVGEGAKQVSASGENKRNVIRPSNKQSVLSSGAAKDGNSKKRARKNPAENVLSVEAIAGARENTAQSKEKNPNAAINSAAGSPGKSSKAGQGPTATTDTDRSPKKRKKKKKKQQQPSGPERAEIMPLKHHRNNRDAAEIEGNTKTKTPRSNNNVRESSSDLTPTIPLPKISLPRPSQMSSLQRAFLERLASSRFRELNEELYTHSSGQSLEHFTRQPELFEQYHIGFRKQAEEWPVNPVDVIYKKIVKEYAKGNTKGKEGRSTGGGGEGAMEQVVVADFGCGDAKLAAQLLALQIAPDGRILRAAAGKGKKAPPATDGSAARPFKVHSFDLVSGGNTLVTPADMAAVPLPAEAVDVAVYSLALMGTNVADFVREAWRVLRFGGALRVAEVRSRFETAAAVADDEKPARGGGKRSKLNKGPKHPRKGTERGKGGTGADSDGNKAPQPLMLLDEFMALMERCGFQSTSLDRSNKMFLFMDFIKADGSKGLSKKETFTAKPCIYKRR